MRVLRIESLPSAKIWVDKDQLLLHSSFQILKDYVEKEKGDIHCNYESHKDFVDEVRFLYKWWIKRVTTEEIQDVQYGREDEDSQDVEDNKMLVRLINIRLQLWT